MIFPDKSWEEDTGLVYGLVILIGLSLYWISPWIIVSGYFHDGQMVLIPNWLISATIFFFGIGVFLHFSSDMQKHTALKLNPGKLITDGLFKKSRNMNYVGEFLIYLSFSLLSMHWLPILVLAVFILLVWVPNMIKKDKSLSRYQEFSKYKTTTRIF
jgi:steroid 5-alpha reductase family enzyme